MKVKDVMTSDVKACRQRTDLAAAVKLMWDSDCGVLPVLNKEDQVVGMITDRDIAIAAGTNRRLASDILVGEIAAEDVHSTLSNDDIHSALKTMENFKLRRLPVVDENGHLEGILSINDIVLRAEEESGRRHPELSYKDAVSAVKAICEHRPLHSQVAA